MDDKDMMDEKDKITVENKHKSGWCVKCGGLYPRKKKL